MKKMSVKKLTNVERKKLLDAAKRIYTHKLMQAKGFEMMVIGASAAAITYVIGTLFSIVI